MNRLRFLRYLTILTILSLGMAGCSAASPRQIAAYPAKPSSAQPLPPRILVHEASLELEVRDPAATAEQVNRLAYEHGGYMENSQTWYREGRQYIDLELAVPEIHFIGLLRALENLGSVTAESVSGRLTQTSVSRFEQDQWNTYAQLTVHLRPTSFAWSGTAPAHWNPLRTFRRAFSVFSLIFSFLVDALIWISVVAGPFVLAALVVRGLQRRRRLSP